MDLIDISNISYYYGKLVFIVVINLIIRLEARRETELYCCSPRGRRARSALPEVVASSSTSTIPLRAAGAPLVCPVVYSFRAGTFINFHIRGSGHHCCPRPAPVGPPASKRSCSARRAPRCARERHLAAGGPNDSIGHLSKLL